MSAFPTLEREIKRIRKFYQKLDQSKMPIRQVARNGEIITIPVVVHIVYQNEEENLSDLIIQSGSNRSD